MGERLMRKALQAMVVGAVVAGTALAAGAEVVTDGTMGPAGALAGPDFSIPGALGTKVGSNLFHSFSAFNLFTGESATFSGPGSIANVIARVTGGDTSSLNGPLRCTIQGANLFFLNPAGILFGPEASLDLSGSFYASTASSLSLGKNGIFDVANPANDLLTTAPPQAFGFVGANPGPITMDSSALAVAEGESISLIGGRLTLDNWGAQTMLQAPGGAVNLVAAAAAGEVGLTASGVQSDGLSRLGQITIRNSSGFWGDPDIDVGSASGGGGEINIRGGRFVLDGANLASDSRGVGPGRDITIEARKSALLTNWSSVVTGTYSGAQGGSIRITTPDLTVEGASTIRTSTWSGAANGGRGGEIDIDAGAVSVWGYVVADDELYHSAIYSSSNGTGRAGDITIDAQTVAVESEGWVSSDAKAAGAGGDLRITAEEIWVSDHGWVSTDTFGSGKAGDLDLRAGFVGVESGGKITSDTYGAGDAGTVAIHADGLGIYVGGYTEIDGEILFSAIRTETFGSGNGGKIDLSAPYILVEEGGGIDSRSDDEATGDGGDISIVTDDLRVTGYVLVGDSTHRSNINASSYGSGEAGDITIDAATVTVEDEGVIYSDANGAGGGGHVRINAGRLAVRDHGWLSTDTYGAGNAGSLAIVAGEVAVTAGGRITSDTYDAGKAGDLTITADDILVSGYLQEVDGETFASRISSDAVGSGRGGAISLTGSHILVEDGGEIASRSRHAGSGDGGNISIVADDLTVRRVGAINASSFGDGAAGDITIQAGSVALEEVGTIASFANAAGDGGNIAITADTLSVKGVAEFNNKLYRSLINASSYGAGQAGDIDIQAGAMTLADGGGVISLATATGSGGNISIAADELTLTGFGTENGLVGKSIIDASSEGSGAAGDITIDAGAVTLAGGGSIASTALSSGHGGDIAITADTLQVGGWAAVDDMVYVSTIDASSYGSGAAGDITIDSGSVTVHDAGAINSLANGSGRGGNIAITSDTLSVTGYALVNDTFFLSAIDASSQGSGAAGDIAIDAGQVTVADAGNITSLARESGAGGNISIKANDLVVEGYTGMSDSFHRSCIDSSSYGAGDAGNVSIAAGTVAVRDEARIASLAFADGNGGDVDIRAGTLQVAGAAVVNGVAYASSINAASSGAGAAGDITINAGTVALDGAGAIETYAQSSGRGGNIAITADRLAVRGAFTAGGEIFQSLINASSYGSGAAGDITINSREVVIADGGGIATIATSTGSGGDVSLTADTLEIKGYHRAAHQFAQSAINASAFGAGDAGDIAIAAGTVTLSETGAIASMTAASGAGGHIGLTADALTVTGQVDEEGETYHSLITGSSAGSGRAGDITIGASTILVADGGGIASSARAAGDGGTITLTADELTVRGKSGLNVSSYGSGAAGNIVATADTVRLEDGGAILSMASSTGNGGTIAINAADSLLLTDAGLISASTSTEEGAGRAGNIHLRAGNLLRMTRSEVATSSMNADGGDITIDPTLIDLIDSEITTSVQGGTGNGGNITMSAQAVVLDHSTVSANAYGGNGGNITITADLLLKDPASLLSASSALGLQGVIALNVPQVDIGAEVVNLPEAFFDDEALYPKSCVEREEDMSTFVVRGRDGLPPSPASLLLGL